MRYLNTKGIYGVETVDQLDPNDFANRSDFRKELRRLVGEYRLAGMQVYISQRCDNTWKSK